MPVASSVVAVRAAVEERHQQHAAKSGNGRADPQRATCHQDCHDDEHGNAAGEHQQSMAKPAASLAGFRGWFLDSGRPCPAAHGELHSDDGTYPSPL